MHKHQGLTKPQIAVYFRAATRAARELGEHLNDYRKRVMRDVCGVDSVRDLNRTGDFDAVMSRFYEDAGDYAAASQYLIGDHRRIGYIIKVCAIQLMQLKSANQAEARRYLAGVLDRCRIAHGVQLDTDAYWMDLSIGEALKVFQILDTHRRRLLRGYVGPSTFSPNVRYSFSGDTLMRERVTSDYYESQPFNVTLSA